MTSEARETGDSIPLAPEWLDDPVPWDVYPDDEVDLAEPLADIRQEHAIAQIRDELDALNHAAQERVDLHSLRKRHAWRLFSVTALWIVVIWVVIFFQGFRLAGFALSDAVLIAFITSTTASVLGLYGIAAYWLFGNGKRPVPATKDSQG